MLFNRGYRSRRHHLNSTTQEAPCIRQLRLLLRQRICFSGMYLNALIPDLTLPDRSATTRLVLSKQITGSCSVDYSPGYPLGSAWPSTSIPAAPEEREW
ncbi:hypothetical protein BV20DRAFT_351386 [Pilatotrama ljubarskyi]|nr:hypothetical protein BV20DRAFT_351386 [Pilatotrama ljubarskyi]